MVANDSVTDRMGYRYSFLGKDLLGAFGKDLTNHSAALRLLSTARAPNVRKLDEVIARKKPVIDEASFVNLNSVIVKYRTCLLPFGHTDEGVTHLIGCMRWKAS